ncbi:MAG: ribosomal L7Ae/L30e/S12e/Gadd45 family protein [Bacilli bacterium]|nr:ribosomal L7Ae/L30e/S12e/Gadd45 family protein [Bacillales bacterium]MDY2575383.1 ribosomal L7Ae/L30e/S12e/Gadd45 family protein [Bacilli bacterium]
MQEKIKSMINFAIRAKKYTIGENVIYSKKVKLAILALDTSLKSKKRYIDKLNYYHIPFIEYGTKEEIGNLLNKKEVAILGITEVNISKEIKKLIKEDEIDGLQQ